MWVLLSLACIGQARLLDGCTMTLTPLRTSRFTLAGANGARRSHTDWSSRLIAITWRGDWGQKLIYVYSTYMLSNKQVLTYLYGVESSWDNILTHSGKII